VENRLLSGVPDVFGKGAQKAEETEQTVSELHAKIGQLTRACPMSGANALGIVTHTFNENERGNGPKWFFRSRPSILGQAPSHVV